MEVRLPRLHAAQWEVAQKRKRFTTLACGRRWGKTMLGTGLVCKGAMETNLPYWWVAPSYKMARVGWRGLKHIAAQVPGSQKSETDKAIIFPSGGVAQVRSADEPDSLRGEGLGGVVGDEAAFIKEDAWNEALRPALSDHNGWALMISTPKGRNWFWRQFVSDSDDHISFTFPTTSNPFIDPAEVEAARLTLPDRVFRQEYLAEFIDDAGGVFRKVTDAILLRTPGSGPYVVGVDWGKHEDFTVLTVLDQATGHVVAIDRFNQIDYAVQLGRLEALVKRWNPNMILVEQNSMGEPLLEMLQRRSLPVDGFQTTAQSKVQIIEALALAFERGEVSLPADDRLTAELQAYEMKRLPSGRMQYSAPDGMHDDMVMSLALAWWAHVGQPHWLIN